MTKAIQDINTFLEELDRMTPWWKKIYYWFYRKTRDIRFFIFDEVPCYFHRAKKGYSYIDTWSFDAYLCRVIAGGVGDLKNRHFGRPADLSAEEWDEILGKIIDGFLAGQKIIDMDFWVVGDDAGTNMKMENRLRVEFEEGVDLFKKYFFHLWD